MNTDTPETDALYRYGERIHLIEHARKLERERDEAREESIRWMSIAEGRGRTDDDEQLATISKPSNP
jgi:hypothetical protein